MTEIVELVAAGRGACLVPAAAASYYSRPDLAYVPVNDIAPAVVSLARRPGPATAIVAAFTDSARRATQRAPGPAAAAGPPLREATG